MANDNLAQESQIDLMEWGKDRGIKYFMVNFTDIKGVQRTKLVPIRAIDRVQENGAGFAAFAADFDYLPAEPDMMVMPDADQVIQIPWQRDVAWVPGNPVIRGEYTMQAPRNVLRKQMKDAAELGLYFKIGVEPEFQFLTPDGRALADSYDTLSKPCYDQQSMMRNMHVIREASAYMHEMGWGGYQNDHEDGNGQWEMNWDFDDVLKMSDQLSFFKFMIRTIAEKHGMRVTFMPKPLGPLTGNGLHIHISAWDGEGKDAKTNLFRDDSHSHGLSPLGLNFLGGIIRHGSGTTVISCPTVNSYKRVGSVATASGASWAPSKVTWSGDNRTHLMRVPGGGRMENRLPDGSVNPYLLPAINMAAGILGVRSKADPGKPLDDIDMHHEGHKITDAPKLPENLLDALRAYEADTDLVAQMSEEFTSAFCNKKRAEWLQYCAELSDWERANTLDC
ncbi:type III glutamate--ammonia ligase [Pontibaca methylaminivorans]|uniref:Glutamine synthetase n=1 Tax=Pontibaca methylaminivorans TaxID=515897 RepID=A0A1R3WVW8_9RHOB|nr:type III glutamate--ammonia ligase [Pontibaca methylaminivorans]SIT82280.1 glutamine synthetase [Pontibaca methylaminivorans]